MLISNLLMNFLNLRYRADIGDVIKGSAKKTHILCNISGEQQLEISTLGKTKKDQNSNLVHVYLRTKQMHPTTGCEGNTVTIATT